MPTYIGLTIGSIYKTMLRAKKTREVWATSYLFSWLMGKIVAQIPAEQLITPAHVDVAKIQYTGAGLYPDRMIVLADSIITFEAVCGFVDSAITALAQHFKQTLPTEGKDKIADYLKQYFQCYLVEAEVSDTESINHILDGMDSVPQYVPCFEKDYMQDYLAKIGTKENPFTLEVFGKEKGNAKFPSTLDIAALPLARTNPVNFKMVYENTYSKGKSQIEDDDTSFLTNIKRNFPTDFVARHKYIAIVNADGDNVGKLFGSLDDAGKIRLSQALVAFGEEAAKEVEKYVINPKYYSGVPMYLGGDDVMFFAPVYNGEETLFELLDRLDTIFEAKMKDLVVQAKASGIDISPSLSYGVSLTHYKYPLNEARDLSHDLLFEKAKKLIHFPLNKDKGNDIPNKNAIAIGVLKHSGQYFEVKFGKKMEAYQTFKDMMKAYFQASEGNKKAEIDIYFNSVTFSLARNIDTLNVILQDKELSAQMLRNFFQNTFNENEHSRIQKYIEQTVTLILQFYEVWHEKETKGHLPPALFQAYSSLRIIHFLNSKDEHGDE